MNSSHSPQSSAWGCGALNTQETVSMVYLCMGMNPNDNETSVVDFDSLKTHEPLKRFLKIGPYCKPQAEAWGE